MQNQNDTFLQIKCCPSKKFQPKANGCRVRGGDAFAEGGHALA